VATQGHSCWVIAIAFSTDGKLIASASEDKSVKLWDTNTMKEIATFREHSDRVFSLAFSA
jgi:WD40 repeat protein